MTPKLSSYWLYFVTSTSYKLATALVNSMKTEVICRNQHINHILGITPMPYQSALQHAFSSIEKNEVISSWKDAFSSSDFTFPLSQSITVPTYGCYKDRQNSTAANPEACIEKNLEHWGRNRVVLWQLAMEDKRSD
jgi:hypothetical protein